MKNILEKSKKEFEEYTKKYAIDWGGILKKDHSIRVGELSLEIAKSLGLSEEEQILAMICGLYHDIGRFEQWETYHTFDDQKSINHGDLGCQVYKKVFQKRLGLEEEKDKEVQNCILYHNRYQIPPELESKNPNYLKIVKDADKIDILYLCAVGEITFKEEGPFTKKVLDSIFCEKIVDNLEMKTASDRILRTIGFIYDLFYPKSEELIKENNYIEELINREIKQSKRKENQEELVRIKQKVKTYMEGKNVR